jgi:hypothetical protein
MDRSSVGQTVWDPSTGGFEIWLRGAQAVECLSLWELWEGNQGWGAPLLGTLKDMWEGLWRRASLSIAVMSLGTWRRAHLPGMKDG